MFLHTLGEMARSTSILIHAFALMDNHYHLAEWGQANIFDILMPSSRHYQQVIALRPEWACLRAGTHRQAEVRVCAEGVELSDQQKNVILPMESIKMVMTRGKDDEEALYELLGNKDERKKFDTQRIEV